MWRDDYRYALELERKDGTALGQFNVTPDWEPAREWTRFTGLREGKRFAFQPGAVTTIEPQWDAKAGEPYVGGVRVSIAGNGSGEVVATVPLAYFKSAAQQIGQTLVERKVLEAGEHFNYTVLAFPGRKDLAPRPKLSFTVEEVAPDLRLRAARLADFLGRATEFGTISSDDFPVFVPQSVLDEASAMTRQAEANEIGGILIGQLCEDGEQRRLFLEVTALIMAKHTLQETTKITFTPETWAALDAAIKLRRSDEQMVGWFHSHPAKYWCSPTCSPEARRNCPLGRNFFSGEDRMLHRTVFSAAHCVALVATNTDDGLRYALFGWQQGVIAQRGFHVLNSTNPLAEATAAEAPNGGQHEEVCT